MGEKTYYSMDPMGKLMCHKCRRELVRGKAVFSYLGNAFPVELPVCPECGYIYVRYIYVPEELAVGKVLSVERSLEDK